MSKLIRLFICFDKQPILLIGILLFLVGCDSRKKVDYDVPVSIIDYESLTSRNFEQIPEDIVSKMEFVAFDTVSDALFGRVDKVKFVDSSLFILDQRLNAILEFDRSGKFIRKFQRKGRALYEYLQITDFDIDRESGVLYVLDSHTDKVNLYDSDFNFIASHTLDFEADILKSVGGKIIFGLASWNSGRAKGYKIGQTDSQCKMENLVLYYDEYIDPAYVFSSYRFTDCEQNVVYNQPIDNNAYVLSRDLNLRQIIRFDFGACNVPDENKKDVESKLDKFENYCFIKDYVAVKGDLIIGKLRDHGKSRCFIVDRKNGIKYESQPVELFSNSLFTEYDDPFIFSYFMTTNVNPKDVSLPDHIIDHIHAGGCAIGIQQLK